MPLIVDRYGEKAFIISENGIKVTLPYNWKISFTENSIKTKNIKDLKTKKPVDKLVDKLADKISNTDRIVLEYIVFNTTDSQPVIAQNLNLGKTTIQNAIVKFKKYKIIKRIGSNKTGKWQII